MKKIHDTIGSFTAMLLLLLIINLFFDVVLRYFFNTTFIWLQEFEWHLFAVMFLFGIAYAINEESHVRVDFVYDTHKPKTKAYINIVGTVLFLIPFALFVVFDSFDFVYDAYDYGEISEDPGGLTHRWIIKFMIPLSFAFIFAMSLLYIKTNITKLKETK